MARYKTLTKKIRLRKQERRTKWAPFWAIPKVFGQGKRVHPSRITRIKRSWRKTRIQQKVKNQERRFIKSGRIRKKF